MRDRGNRNRRRALPLVLGVCITAAASVVASSAATVSSTPTRNAAAPVAENLPVTKAVRRVLRAAFVAENSDLGSVRGPPIGRVCLQAPDIPRTCDRYKVEYSRWQRVEYAEGQFWTPQADPSKRRATFKRRVGGRWDAQRGYGYVVLPCPVLRAWKRPC